MSVLRKIFNYVNYMYNICRCNSNNSLDNLEEPLLKFCENEETNLYIDTQAIMRLHTIPENNECAYEEHC